MVLNRIETCFITDDKAVKSLQVVRTIVFLSVGTEISFKFKKTLNPTTIKVPITAFNRFGPVIERGMPRINDRVNPFSESEPWSSLITQRSSFRTWRIPGGDGRQMKKLLRAR